ncbi:MAG: Appr-1-p processing protein [Chloroflexota bacterium]|nr:Appr-1-p processing protein [Chloroflexota bacterium]
MGIRYVVGDATRPEGTGPRVIVHICNDIGAWGRGFVMALSQRWQEPERQYRRWHRGLEAVPFALGQAQLVPVEEQLWVANLIGQHDIRRAGGRPPIRYDAVREGLSRVAHSALEHAATVHMPRIGSGLAGGDWEIISRIIGEELTENGIQVTVYDLG